MKHSRMERVKEQIYRPQLHHDQNGERAIPKIHSLSKSSVALNHFIPTQFKPHHQRPKNLIPHPTSNLSYTSEAEVAHNLHTPLAAAVAGIHPGAEARHIPAEAAVLHTPDTAGAAGSSDTGAAGHMAAVAGDILAAGVADTGREGIPVAAGHRAGVVRSLGCSFARIALGWDTGSEGRRRFSRLGRRMRSRLRRGASLGSGGLISRGIFFFFWKWIFGLI